MNMTRIPARPLAFGLILALVSAAAFAPLRAQPVRTEAPGLSQQIADFLEPNGSTSDFNGGVVLADATARPVFSTVGLASLASGELLDSASVFQAASIAKPLTAIAILQLRDAGKLRLDQPVTSLLDWFPVSGVTVRQLLTHTSGLPDLEVYEGLVAAHPDLVVSLSDLPAAFAQWRPDSAPEPGVRFRYSNINFQVLAAIVEKVSGEQFCDYMRNHIFHPAGMRQTYVLGDPEAPAASTPVRLHVRATMYETAPQDIATVVYLDQRRMRRLRYETFNLGSTVGDQNLFTSLPDLLALHLALRDGVILSGESRDEAWQPARLANGETILEARPSPVYGVRCSYGLGFEVCDHPARGRLVGHGGYNRGIATQFVISPSTGRMIAGFDNADGVGFGLRVAGLLALLGGEPAPAIDRRGSITRAYGEALLRDGPGPARALFDQLRQQQDRWTFSGAGLNQLGYDLLRNGHEQLSLAPFRLNVELNPEEGDYFDSLGEAYAVLGQTAEAIAAYTRAVELDPANSNAREALDRLRQ